MEKLRSGVRPVVTLMLVTVVCAGFIMGRVTADQFLPIASTAVLWWYADRTARRGNGS